MAISSFIFIILSTFTTHFNIHADGFEPMMYGGELVPEESPLYQAAVYWDNDFGSCSGTLITKNIILTAAHCFDEVKKLGDVYFYKNKKKQVRSKIIQAWVHEKYTAKDRTDEEALKIPLYDIALIKIADDAPKGYFPAMIDWNRRPQFLEKLTLAGYGIGSRGALNKLTETMVNYSEPAKMIVFDQDKTFGICYGDSGGPAFYQDKMKNAQPVLAGLASEFYVYDVNSKMVRNSTRKQCLSGGAVTYTSIADYRDWIEEKIK